MPPKQRKIAIMGNRSVGKSSLSIQFVEGQFVDSYDPTIENRRISSSQDDLDDDGGSLYAQSISGAAGKTEMDTHEHLD